MYGLVMTLTFNLQTSKSNQFTFITVSTKTVNVAKFPQAVYRNVFTNFRDPRKD